MDKMVNKYWKDIKAFLKLNSHKRPHFYRVFCKDYKLLLSLMVFPQKEASSFHYLHVKLYGNAKHKDPVA